MHKVMAADIFVYLDTVQFSKNGLQNRNQVKTGSSAHWLTVPVKQKLGQSIRDTEVADVKATRKHLKTLQANYAHSEGWRRWETELATLLESEPRSLSELAIASTEWLLSKLRTDTKRVRASELSATEGHASKLVASLCAQLNATTYLTGSGALEYLDLEDFRSINCNVQVQQWKSLTYQQQQVNSEFIPNLSCLDLVLNVPDQAAELIQASGSWKPLE